MSVSEPQTVADRPIFLSAKRGMRNTCPSCGTGVLFEKTLKVNDQCGHCGEELHHHRADDLPAYLSIFIVGHVVVALMMIVLQMDIMGMWTLMALSIALAVILAFAMMRPLKGMVVGAQWAMRMHGFGGHRD